ncbi:S-adenosylmethionine--tRNA ribosyltransferase-isomerase [Polaribacter sp. Hel1_33_78]|mgnify:CR=1 FL=1|jgi:S-adenosylmethionine:tRNA ribosyltransferase-isomerase|uniref:tRNA preQ1(34) S-adenosylmethionine ribosyltransferase-isomerase QueA n=1 Tax=unclassified Polaribacter TaxID=196858 RepID=UPI00052C570D|nr:MULTISPECIES: tRNA preQ1(34) S-adenosylmethionine ribosyltransferase-isomerase QueA [unclassified Polaribacter]KGL59828.1 S-adenosylmethionine:tRNA ribosyltransferase-isomerase [Polaribacter sp. Hel1_33_49]MBT3742945.1 tRNA preQ1(34) S-adenosylmethionine ribosyltransferase-isomerase QueA [Polaribacter sp.]MBT4414344.1 tRNA preQ1(34) S-adenosylmethionine ribosyltransferase-isomerase QueA [Polaribacter sp.]MBT7816431.1 tRNA preQ1(34) S-adenosylmethionine ribosyltransferase-isomerase QueA [Pola
MKLSHFEFELPEELLAIYPAEHRDESRLMVLNRKEQTIEHKTFKDVINYFEEGDVMMLNNTKVFPARMFGNKEKTGARIEVFLLRELNAENRLWDVLVDPARKIRIGNKLFFGEDDSLVAEVIDNTTSRGRTLRFLYDGSYEAFREKLLELGETPLPKAINREVEASDEERYQTIYAKHEGAVAAPSAGLHFSKHLLKRLEIKGVDFSEMTLHVGLGTFSPVEVEDLSKHKMDSEQIVISAATADKINKAKKAKRRICAVGTTVMRTVESSVSSKQELNAFEGWTNKFIFPPFDFSIANSMITNFHAPKSTLMMQAAAFAGYDFLMEAYKVAIKEQYKFSTYGDAMLII